MSDYMRFSFLCKKEKPSPKGKSVGIIGSGPAGLAAAGLLACEGYEVVIYERLPFPGGLMVFGIPELRIPKKRVLDGVKELEEIYGVEVKTSVKVFSGEERKIVGDEFVKERIPLEHVIDQHDAVLITTGTWIPRKPPVEGVDLSGVYTALDFLFRRRAYELGLILESQTLPLGKKVGVVGAGLVAVDAALEAAFMGSEVYLLTIETIEEAPAGSYEITRLLEYAVRHIPRVIVTKILGEKKIEGVVISDVEVEWENGRIKSLKPKEGTERTIELDTLIFAIGQGPTPPMVQEVAGIKLTKRGYIQVDEYWRTTRENVFAAGDIVTGPSKVGRAIGSGLKAGRAIDLYLKGAL